MPCLWVLQYCAAAVLLYLDACKSPARRWSSTIAVHPMHFWQQQMTGSRCRHAQSRSAECYAPCLSKDG